MKYHIKVGDVVKYADMDDGIKIVHSELTSIPPKIKEMWDEADEKKITMKEIVEKVKKVRSQVYNEEYGVIEMIYPFLQGLCRNREFMLDEKIGVNFYIRVRKTKYKQL